MRGLKVDPCPYGLVDEGHDLQRLVELDSAELVPSLVVVVADAFACPLRLHL